MKFRSEKPIFKQFIIIKDEMDMFEKEELKKDKNFKK